MEQPELRFRLLLAKTLSCTLEELGERMTAEEYGLWMAWHSREPLDSGWHQAGVLASVVANVNRKAGSDPYRATDFMPDPWKTEEVNEMDPAEFARRYG